MPSVESSPKRSPGSHVSRQGKALLAAAGVMVVALLSLGFASSNRYLPARLPVPQKRLPDLTSTISVSKTSLIVGQSLTVTATVRNSGTANAGVSTTRFDVMSNLGGLGSMRTSSLTVGKSVRLSRTWRATKPGTYWFQVCADRPNVITESNENNNCSGRSRSVTVTTKLVSPSPSPSPSWPPTPIIDGPDLTSTISVSRTLLTVGDSLTVTATVRNGGLWTAGASTTRFDVMSNRGALGSVSTPSLAAGASVTLSKTWTATTGGTYWFQVCADQQNVVTESNETNNCSGPSSNVIVLYPPHSPSPSPSYFPSPSPSRYPPTTPPPYS